LQVSEQFQVSFVDKDHAFIKRRADSVFGPSDTGLKLTMLFVIGVQNNQQGPKFNLYKQQIENSTTDSNDQVPLQSINLSGNTMILWNSRAFEYEILDSDAKTFMLFN